MVEDLADGVHRIECRGVNAYLLDREQVVLVDAGTPLDAGRIREGVAAAGHSLPAVDRVVATHFDLDHVGALWRLDDELDAPVSMPDPDASYLTRTLPLPRSRKGLLQRLLRPFARPPALPVERVADGDEVAGLVAHRTPGHTRGHTAYATAGGDAAFLGDLVGEDDGSLAVLPGLLQEDAEQVRESVRAFEGAAPAFDVAAVGHGDPLATGGREALSDLAETLRG